MRRRAEWETRLTQSLPENLKGNLPSIEEIEAELSEKYFLKKTIG